MRVYIILLILMISTNCLAQFHGVYPLAPENMWVYTESYYAGLYENNYQSIITSNYKDTVYTGAPYYLLDTMHTIDSINYYTIKQPYLNFAIYYYERVRSDDYVVIYDGESYPEPNHERIIYKENAKIGDHWAQWSNDSNDTVYTSVVDTSQELWLGQYITIKVLHHTDSLLEDYYEKWTEKFGLVYQTFEFSNYYIKGAVIDGVLYGDTSWYVTEVKGNIKPVNNFWLYQNYPNPFNPTTVIKYRIPKDKFVSLKVYNMLGQMVADLVNANKQAGTYEISFDGSKLSSGVYFYILKVGQNGSEYIKAAKMLLLK